MADPFAPVAENQPLDIYAEAWNAMLADTKVRRARPRGANGGAGEFATPTATKIMVYNNTGSMLEQWAIVSVGAPSYIPASAGNFFEHRESYEANAPTAGGLFAVCQEAIPAGYCGLAVIGGVTPCVLNITATGDTHASATTSTTELTTGTGGRAEIIYKASGTGSGKLGVVSIGGMPLAGAEVLDIDYVSKICFTYNSYGTGITGASIEHKKIRVLGVPLTYESYCTSTDTDCCPGIFLPCTLDDDGNARIIPAELTLRIRGHGTCSDLDMCFVLTATTDPAYLYHDHLSWVAHIDDLPGIPPGSVVILHYVCNSAFSPLDETTGAFWWQWTNGPGNFVGAVSGYCNLGTYSPDGVNGYPGANWRGNNTESFDPLVLVSRGVAYSNYPGGDPACCLTEDNFPTSGNYVTLEAYDTDVDCEDFGGGGGETACASCTACDPAPAEWEVDEEPFPAMVCRDPSLGGLDWDCLYSQYTSLGFGWLLFHVPDEGWYLGNAATTYYFLADGDFDCAGPNTFTKLGYPDITITVPT